MLPATWAWQEPVIRARYPLIRKGKHQDTLLGFTTPNSAGAAGAGAARSTQPQNGWLRGSAQPRTPGSAADLVFRPISLSVTVSTPRFGGIYRQTRRL